MMPQFTPTNLFSACCESFTISSIGRPKENASFKMTDMSTSSDADEERPAPPGSVPLMTMSKPCDALYPAFSKTSTTPMK